MSKIIIIGAGVAGLSAGIKARLSGHEALIYERHFRAGGNLTGWNRDGYHIDNCIHWLTGTNKVTKLYKMWEELGVLGNVPIYQAENLFTLSLGGETLSLNKDLDKLKEDMLRISPEDKKETLAFIRAIKAFQKVNGVAGKNCDKKSNIFQKIFAIPALLKYYSLTTKDLAMRFKNKLIREFLRCYLTDHFASLALIMVFATFTSGDGALPEGISVKMAERMTEKFTTLGGELHLGCGVSKINLSGERAESVTLDDGTVVYGDFIVPTLDPAVTFGTILDKDLMPEELKNNYQNPKMLRFSSHHSAFACEMSDLPFEGDTMLEIPEEYRELFCARYLMLREFSHEKGFAPEGKNVLQTMIYTLEEDSQKFIDLYADKAAYAERKKKLAECTEDIITRYYPTLKGTLKCLDVWTPASYKRYVNSEIGSFMAFMLPVKTPPLKISGKITGASNVILGTQWQKNPGGLPIAADMGIYAIKQINKIARK